MNFLLVKKLYLRCWSRHTVFRGHPDIKLKRRFEANSKFVDLYWVPYSENRKIICNALYVRVNWPDLYSAIKNEESVVIPRELAEHGH